MDNYVVLCDLLIVYILWKKNMTLYYSKYYYKYYSPGIILRHGNFVG